MGIKMSITPDNKCWLLSLAGAVILCVPLALSIGYIVEELWLIL